MEKNELPENPVGFFVNVIVRVVDGIRSEKAYEVTTLERQFFFNTDVKRDDMEAEAQSIALQVEQELQGHAASIEYFS